MSTSWRTTALGIVTILVMGGLQALDKFDAATMGGLVSVFTAVAAKNTYEGHAERKQLTASQGPQG